MMKALLPDNDWESDQRLKSELRGQRVKGRSTNSPYQLWRPADKKRSATVSRSSPGRLLRPVII